MAEELGIDPNEDTRRDVRDFNDGKPEIGASYAGDDDEYTRPDVSTGTSFNESPAINSLRDALKQKVTLERITLDIPQRPGISIMADPNLVNQQKIDLWNRKSKDKKAMGGTDSKKFAEHVLIATVVGLKFNGEEQTDEQGRGLTFYSKELWSMLGVQHVALAVQALIGPDGHILQLGNRIIEAAGYEQTDFDSAPEMNDDENPIY